MRFLLLLLQLAESDRIQTQSRQADDPSRSLQQDEERKRQMRVYRAYPLGWYWQSASVWSVGWDGWVVGWGLDSDRSMRWQVKLRLRSDSEAKKLSDRAGAETEDLTRPACTPRGVECEAIDDSFSHPLAHHSWRYDGGMSDCMRVSRE